MIVYTSQGCGKCQILKQKLQEKGIEFEESHNIDKLIDMGFAQLPIVEIDGNFYNYREAVEKINVF